MRKTAISCVRSRRPRRPWWRRKRWWAALGVYGLGLSLVLGHMSDRRWGRQSTDVGDSSVASAPDTQPMSRAFERPAGAMWAGGSPEGLTRDRVPTPDAPIPTRSMGNGKGNGGSSTISATWLIRQETRHEMEREQGPGFKDVKMVTFELPDLKSSSPR